jgi:hypothetical protein
MELKQMSDKNALTKQQILNRKPLLQEVQLPQWGGFVYIRPLTVAEQTKLAELGTKFEKANTAARIKNITLQVIKWSVTDADGAPLFDDGDLDQLLQADASAIMSLQDAIIRYSGLTEESRRELEKNLLSRAEEASS